MSDTFGASRKFRMLAVHDDCCRENLCLMADKSISGARVARELDALVRAYGKPLAQPKGEGGFMCACLKCVGWQAGTQC